ARRRYVARHMRKRAFLVLAAAMVCAPARPAHGIKITEVPIPTAGAQPFGIALGADGRVWFSEHAKDKIGAVTPAGSIVEYALPAGTGPLFIAPGPKRALVFTTDVNKLGLIDSANGSFSLTSVGGDAAVDGVARADALIWQAQ